MAQTAVPTSAGKVWVFYAFALPFAVLTIVFGLWPIVLSLLVSMTDSATALRPEPRYVGLENYRDVLGDPIFLRSLVSTLIYTVAAVLLNLSFALFYALLLNSTLIGPGRTLLKVAMFLPVVTPDIAGYAVWRWLFDSSFGAINEALSVLHLPPFGGIASPDTVMIAVLIAELWHHAGFYILIFLANLAICDRALEEAAAIDGATRWQRKFFIVLPQLRPALLINGIYALIQFLKTFTVVVVMTKGGPNGSTNFVSYYAYNLFDQGRYGEATAMASILFFIVAAVALVAYRIGDRGATR